MSGDFWLVGTGSVFEAIAGDPAGHGLPEGWAMRRAESVAAVAGSVDALLAGLEPASTLLFVAIDQNALNHARLGLYGAARLRGLRMGILVHARAIVAPDAHLADNVWIGPGAMVGSGSKVASDVMVGAGARLDSHVRIGMHGWIGPGASIGANVEIGNHCVIGADARLREGMKVGRSCVVDTTAPQSGELAAGSFIAPHFESAARMIGAGYSFEKQR